MKKILLALLPFTIMLCIILTNVSVKAKGYTSGYYTYTVTDGNATITDVNTAISGISGKVTVPSTLGGYPVTAIGDRAYQQCSNIKTIIIPDSVTTIGSWAFYNCNNLTSIAIPNGVTKIADHTFFCCTSLTNITIPNSITDIGNYAVSRCDSLTSIIIPDSVITIGDYAFWGNSSLKSIMIPNSVITIGDNAFYYCDNLMCIDVDSKNQNYCSKDGVLFDKNITTIIQYPTEKPDSSYLIPNTVTKIDNNTFGYCSNLINIIIPDSVMTIGNGSFEYCYNLTSITLPNKVTTIGEHTFSGCTSLINIDLSNNLKSIGSHAFYKCTSLTSMKIPEGVEVIDAYAFWQCISLKSITLPNSVKIIKSFAFDKCSSLTTITIPSSVIEIGFNIFYQCNNLTTINVNSDNENYSSVDGVLFDKNVTRLIHYPIGKENNSYIIPYGVKTIEERAFHACTGLIRIIIPNSITVINESAFYACDNLAEVYYEGSATDWNKIVIGDYNNPLKTAQIVYGKTDIGIDTENKSIEIVNASSANNHLKFISKVTIANNSQISNFGTTFIPLWLFEEGSKDVAIVEYDNENYSIKNGQTFGASLTNIPSNYKDIDIVGKSYIKDNNGIYTWSSAKYASINDTTLKTIE